MREGGGAGREREIKKRRETDKGGKEKGKGRTGRGARAK